MDCSRKRMTRRQDVSIMEIVETLEWRLETIMEKEGKRVPVTCNLSSDPLRGSQCLSPAIARWQCFHPVCLFVCGCLCLSRCLSGRFNYEGLVPHKQYFAGTLLGMSSCASYVSHTHDVIDDVTRSQSRPNFEIDISPSIFELQRRSKAQNVANAHGYLSGIFNFRYNFR